MSTAERIDGRLKTVGEGYVFTPRDMLDLGTRPAVDQALSRLTRAKVVRRLSQGLYYYPRRDSVFGLRAPSTDAIAKALARETGSTIQVIGAQAANQLGLLFQDALELGLLVRKRLLGVLLQFGEQLLRLGEL